jgi:cytidine diphosphoramidate kinase
MLIYILFMLNKSKNYAIWITGLPGSGKTTIGKYFYKKFRKTFGPTLFVNGDDLRNIFNIKKFDIQSRKKIALQYGKFVKFIYSQNINIIFTCVAMFDEVRDYNKKKIQNYYEVFIDASLPQIIKEKKKKLYFKKKNIWLELIYQWNYQKNQIL